MAKQNRNSSTVLSALVAFSGFALTTAPTASAAGYGCSGSQIGAYAVKTSGGTTFDTVYLYYDSSTTTTCTTRVQSPSPPPTTAFTSVR